jgi:hypothetical protein
LICNRRDRAVLREQTFMKRFKRILVADSSGVAVNTNVLLVMGTAARSGVAGTLVGNTAERILSRIKCSVLALKRSTFSCPVHLEESK